MHDMWTDPEANTILALAEFFPMTIGEAEKPFEVPPALGQVIDWDADGNIFAVVEVGMSLSYN